MKIFLMLLLFFLAASCGDEKNKRTLIEKLRGLGVKAEPLISKPSTDDAPQTVNLTFYTAMPLSEKIATVETFVDDATIFALDMDVRIDQASANYEKYAGFKVYTINASFMVPPKALLAFKKTSDAMRLRYAMKFTTTTDDEEKIVGDVWVRPDGAKELEWQQPKVEIEDPDPNAKISKGGDEDIAAKISNPNKEQLKIGWYTGDGEIKNRRARETTWSTSSKAKQSLIVTVRGKQSRGFAIEVRDFVTK